MAKLVINPGTPQTREFELKPGANYLGRGFANDLKIEDPSVSSSHAQIVLNGSSVMVKDLGSTNGTFINRAPVTESVLQPGQLLRLGGVEMLLEADAAGAITVVENTPANTAAPAPPTAVALQVDAASPARPAPSISSPSAGGLRIAGARPAVVVAPPPMRETEAAPPMVEAPPAPAGLVGMVEPPAGKTACKFHPKQAGQWLCQKCTQLFCSACVSVRRTDAGAIYSCRICGTQCVPVRVNFVAAKEKGPKKYSDLTVLLRSAGFGAGGALLGALLWTGFAALTGIDMPPLFCPAVGALCGYAVKLGCQDRPGIIFSLIAVVSCVIGVVLGKFGSVLVTHIFLFTISSLMYSLFGLLIGGFLAWKFGGGDF